MYESHIKEWLASKIYKNYFRYKHGNYRLERNKTNKYLEINEVNGINHSINEKKKKEKIN